MSAGSLKIKIFEEKGTQVVSVAKSTATVGCASHCDVVLDHPSVNPEHARAWLDGGRIWIQDLGTQGGTFLNGIRLPALKPMLVRDVDVLKLGDSPVTLGMEANMVRAPRLASPSVEEVTQTDIKISTSVKDLELEKRREDLAKVSRELAELKLQLQMGRLEKTAIDDLRRQLNALREEVRLEEDRKEQLHLDLKRLQVERENRIQATSTEIQQKKTQAESEIHAMRESAQRKFEHWKVDLTAELGQQIQALTKRKIKEGSPSAELKSWQSEVDQVIREAMTKDGEQLAQEKAAPPAMPAHAPAEAAEPTAAAKKTEARSKSSSKKVLRRPRWQLSSTQSAILGSVSLVLALGFMAHWALSVRKRQASRSVASVTPVTVAASAVPSGPQPAPAPPAVAARYAPKQTKIFKRTYTENVLYTENYADAEMNQAFRQRWMDDLVKTGRKEWQLDDKTIATLAAKEAQLIQDLRRLKDSIQLAREQEGINAMRTRESQFQKDLQSMLGSPAYVERFQRLKSSFFTRNQQYLVKQTR